MSLSEISKHFTEDTLQEIIQKVGGTKFTSYDFIFEPNRKGDSYLSQVFRIKVQGINENTGSSVEVAVIIKTMSKNLNTRKLFRATDFFRNEINFYSKVIPIFEKFQNEKNLMNPFTEYPKYLASHSDGVNDFIALQDVSVLGYKAPDRQSYVDLQNCQLIMRTLGRYHGLSLALKDQKPDLFEEAMNSIEEVYYAEKYRKWYSPFLKDAISVAIDAVAKEYPGTVYEERSRKFLDEHLYDTLINLVSTKNNYSVIGHGDCWRSNFLMKYGDGENKASGIPISGIMIDFQLVRYASSVLDITFFLYSCTDAKMREENYDKILTAYYEGASELIRDLGSDPEKIFPYEALHNELKEFGKFGIGMGIESLPLTLLEDDQVGDMDSLDIENPILTDIWKIGPIKNQENRKRIADCFKHAIDCGYF